MLLTILQWICLIGLIFFVGVQLFRMVLAIIGKIKNRKFEVDDEKRKE